MNDSNIITKCRYFNQGYCKKKSNCKYNHPTIDCEEDCSSSKCPHRHRIQCKDGENCFYNSSDKCEFLHDNVIKLVKGKIKEDNRNLRAKIEELTLIINSKDNDLMEIQRNFNQMLESNKVALERIANLENLANLANREKEVEKNNGMEMKENTDQKIRKFDSRQIKSIKDAIKIEAAHNTIKIYSEKINGKKTNIYYCNQCEIKITNDKEILAHMIDRHRYNCPWKKCGEISFCAFQIRVHEDMAHTILDDDT